MKLPSQGCLCFFAKSVSDEDQASTGHGQPIVYSHGWPLSADDWDAQMLFFMGHGYRVIAHDRRGYGRSTSTGEGNDMDHCAVDLAALTEAPDLLDAIHVGHSTGGGGRRVTWPVMASSARREAVLFIAVG